MSYSRRPASRPKSATGDINGAWVRALINATQQDNPAAVEPLLVLLSVVRENVGELPPDLTDECKTALLAFDYQRFDDKSLRAGAWQEANQLCFAVAEYLAGVFLPRDQFVLDRTTGKEKASAARARILRWLGARFRYGHSNWLDPVSIPLEAAALSLLLDYSTDSDLQDRVEVILDVLLLDAALHQFHGNLSSSTGRINGSIVRNPATSRFAHWWGHAVADDDRTPCALDDVRCLFCSRARYEIPQPILDIAFCYPIRRIRTSQGLTVDEVTRQLTRGDDDSPEALGQFLSGMGVWPADLSRDKDNESWPRFMSRIAISKLPPRLGKQLRAWQDARQAGTELQRANVQTFVTRSYALSSVQRYQPGSFGGQQLIWQAQLPGDIVVFGNHPGDNLRASAPTSSEDRWALHGILPDVAQHDNVLLAIADLRTHKGYQEGKRADYIQFYFPSVKFDETRFGPHWVAGRSGKAYLGILGTSPMELVSESEVVQRGQVTGYAVVLADEEEVTSMAAFVRLLKTYLLTLRGDRLSLTSPYGQYSLTWGRDFVVGGQKVPTEYPRYDTHWVQAPRNPSRMEIHGQTSALELDWTTGSRTIRQI